MEKNPHAKRDRFGTQSPDSGMWKITLFRILQGCDIQILTFIDVPIAEDHAYMIEVRKETVERMSEKPSCSEEARGYFKFISRRAMHFMQASVRALVDEQNVGVEMTSTTDVEDNAIQSWVKAGQPFGQKSSSNQVHYYQAM